MAAGSITKMCDYCSGHEDAGLTSDPHHRHPSLGRGWAAGSTWPSLPLVLLAWALLPCHLALVQSCTPVQVPLPHVLTAQPGQGSRDTQAQVVSKEPSPPRWGPAHPPFCPSCTRWGWLGTHSRPKPPLPLGLLRVTDGLTLLGWVPCSFASMHWLHNLTASGRPQASWEQRSVKTHSGYRYRASPSPWAQHRQSPDLHHQPLCGLRASTLWTSGKTRGREQWFKGDTQRQKEVKEIKKSTPGTHLQIQDCESPSQKSSTAPASPRSAGLQDATKCIKSSL